MQGCDWLIFTVLELTTCMYEGVGRDASHFWLDNVLQSIHERGVSAQPPTTSAVTLKPSDLRSGSCAVSASHFTPGILPALPWLTRTMSIKLGHRSREFDPSTSVGNFKSRASVGNDTSPKEATAPYNFILGVLEFLRDVAGPQIGNVAFSPKILKIGEEVKDPFSLATLSTSLAYHYQSASSLLHEGCKY